MVTLTLLSCLGVSAVTSWDAKRMTLLLVGRESRKLNTPAALGRKPNSVLLVNRFFWKHESEISQGTLPMQRPGSVAEGSLTIITVFSSAGDTARVPFSPPCSSPHANVALYCAYEWRKPCCSLLWNNIKCRVSLNLQTWSSSFQLREWFRRVLLNALCRRRALIAAQSIVQWPSSAPSRFRPRRKDSECSLL